MSLMTMNVCLTVNRSGVWICIQEGIGANLLLYGPRKVWLLLQVAPNVLSRRNPIRDMRAFNSEENPSGSPPSFPFFPQAHCLTRQLVNPVKMWAHCVNIMLREWVMGRDKRWEVSVSKRGGIVFLIRFDRNIHLPTCFVKDDCWGSGVIGLRLGFGTSPSSYCRALLRAKPSNWRKSVWIGSYWMSSLHYLLFCFL